MSELKRTTTVEETLKIEPCPCCGGEVKVMDECYSSFNPGRAECNRCKRKWSLGFVTNAWACGMAWNKRAAVIRRKLMLLSMLSYDRSREPSVNVNDEDFPLAVRELKTDLENFIIGADKEQSK